VSYQVIARKYRPQTFGDLTGQEQIIQTLRHALDGDRLHHAYLFSGVRGTGKTTTARLLAKGLNCHRGRTSEPCLTCPSCLEISLGQSIDVLEIDAASNTGVDNIRDVIINNIAMAPARDRYKVFVIDEVHMLSTSAFNALLKTLEEPPGHVIFILATTELHKVPETILSRCQQFEFRQIPIRQIENRLQEIATQEGITISPTARREIARAGAGSLRDAQSAFDQVIAFCGMEITEEDVARALGLIGIDTLLRATAAIARHETAALLQLVGEIDARGHDLRHFTRELMSCFRHLLLIQAGMEEGEIDGLSEEEKTQLGALAPHFSEADLVRSFHLLAETEREIKDATQPRFHLEVSLVKLAQLRRLRSLERLLEEVTALGGRGGGEGGPPRGDAPAGLGRRSVEGGSQTSLAPAPRLEQELGEGSTVASRRQEARRDTPRPTPLASPSTAPPDLPDPLLTEPYEEISPFSAPSSSVEIQTRTHLQSAPPPPSPQVGREVQAILEELQRINRGFILAALEEAKQLTLADGTLIATFLREDTFAKRIRESGTLFRTIGETLFGRPLRIEVRIETTSQAQDPSSTPPPDQLAEQARQIPAVRQFLDQMRGEIVWVKEQK
jgi:DNA polymerase-3 subunit gamma/tau